MTTSGAGGVKSMRFSLHEVLSGMLASVEVDSFPDDHKRLAAMFETLAGQSTLFAPLASGVDPEALAAAFATLEQKKYLLHEGSSYVLTPEGRNHCIGSKRTLFNKQDREELEEAARSFASL